MSKIICIIPARKGSKRIKNKNIKIFYGKPIISQVIQKLKRFKIFDKIYVSTDCNKIANLAKKHKLVRNYSILEKFLLNAETN